MSLRGAPPEAGRRGNLSNSRLLRLRLAMTLTSFFMVLSGCALTPWSQLKNQEYRFHATGFKAEVPADWMKNNMSGYFLMTKDGVALNHVTVQRFRFKDKLDHTAKKFLPGMFPQDLAEVEIDDLKADEAVRAFTILKNEPRMIDGEDGYFMEYTYSTIRGLKYHGVQCGFVFDEKVYRIRYAAPQQHYYDTTLKDFERFLETFRLLKKEKKDSAGSSKAQSK